jgi:SWI/SNF-related matrix-associated actin-dependent regulator of chromatin subfamily A-like protein 1
LTGTPIVNRPADLLGLLISLGKLKAIFGSWHHFVTRYCNGYRDAFGWNIDGAAHLDELHEILFRHNIMRRCRKDDVLDLPEKTREIRRVTLNPAELDNYSIIEARLRDVIRHKPAVLRDTTFEFLSHIRQAVGLCKVRPAIERLRELLTQTNDKVLVFAHHRAVREALAEAFPDALVLNTEAKDRIALVKEFQTGNARVFITSPRIGGVGITLTAATRVLFAEFDFTAAVHLQAEDRVHRIGQTRPVHVEYLYANATIDGFLLALINRKISIFGQIADGLDDPDYLTRIARLPHHAKEKEMAMT